MDDGPTARNSVMTRAANFRCRAFLPRVIDDFEPLLAATFKIVGVSNDPAAMAELEQDGEQGAEYAGAVP